MVHLKIKHKNDKRGKKVIKMAQKVERGCQGSWGESVRAAEARDSSGACCKLYLLFTTADSPALRSPLSALRSPVGYSTLNAVRAVYHLSCSAAMWNDQETDASLTRVVPMRVSKSSTSSLSLV